MELKHYVLTFDNSKEFLIATDLDTAEKVMNKFNRSIIKLQREKSKPLIIDQGKLFSVHELGSGAIGNQSKIWKVLK